MDASLAKEKPPGGGCGESGMKELPESDAHVFLELSGPAKVFASLFQFDQACAQLGFVHQVAQRETRYR